MPFSFLNMGTTAILLMLFFLSAQEFVKYLKKHFSHSEKQV